MEKRKIDSLVDDVVVGADIKVKEDAINAIWQEAFKEGVYPASIHDLYRARGEGKWAGATVPAMNLRSLTYDLARAIFREASKINAGAFIFEIARSEMGYTDQKPLEYSTVILAAALAENYKGPVFIQGDHFQVNAKNYKEDPQKVIDGLKKLIRESVEAGFYNIDIDSSTVVDLSKEDLLEQQRENSEICAELTAYIRGLQPQGVDISIGGEIGEVGSKNSTPQDLKALLNDLVGLLPFYIADKAHATGIMLKARVIKPLFFRDCPRLHNAVFHLFTSIPNFLILLRIVLRLIPKILAALN